MSAAPEFVPPERVDEYRIARLLGRGAMGRVYLGHDTLLDRPVAIKFIAAEPSRAVRERFLIEARAVARLHHPNVVAIYRVGEVLGRPYLVSEFVAGRSLADLPKPVPVEQALRIGLGLARGLAAAHKSGVLHRDIKPANVILADGGDAKLLDFGLAKLTESAPSLSPAASLPPPVLPPSLTGLEATLSPAEIPSSAATRSRPLPAAPSAEVTLSADGRVGAAEDVAAAPLAAPVPDAPDTASGLPSLTRTGALVGTPRYMPPEAWRGEVATQRSDVYSLGALLYELCSGVPPHRQESVAALGIAVQSTDAAPLRSVAPEVPDALAAPIDRCLRRDPRERFADGSELLAALEGVRLTGPSAPAPAVASGPALRPARPWRAGLGLVLAGGLGLGLLLASRGPRPAPALDASSRPEPASVPDLAAPDRARTALADRSRPAEPRPAEPRPAEPPADAGAGTPDLAPAATAASGGRGKLVRAPVLRPPAAGTRTEPATAPLPQAAPPPKTLLEPPKTQPEPPAEPSNHDIPIER
ncbi:MAG: protein kinase [Polyangia bacterium]